MIRKKILLTGGGTAGSVSPLLAIVDELRDSEPRIRNQEFGFLWIGTESGPEHIMVKEANIQLKVIRSGKLRRYFSWQNFIDIFNIKLGFFQSLFIMIKWRPDLVMSAGAFVSVPVVWAAWLLRVPVIIHQMDARPGLANKLMAPFAKIITVTFEKSLKDYGEKAVWTGNIIRKDIRILGNWDISKIEEGKRQWNLVAGIPVLLIVGGGTGAEFINKLVLENIEKLTEFCQVIHVTGKKKIHNSQFKVQNSRYHQFDFLEPHKMLEALKLSDVVVSRCGMAFLTEISYLAKPSILIPMPDTHQEENAAIFKGNEAAVVLDQKTISSNGFVKAVKDFIDNQSLRNEVSLRIRSVIKCDTSQKIIKIINEVINKR